MESLALMPKYEAYKDSYSDYSGLIPCEWKLIPIRAIFEERNEKNTGPKTDHILSVTRDRGVIPYDEKGAIGNNKSEDIERYKLVYENDLVINKMNVVIGSLGLSKYFGALSQVYIVLRPKTKSFNIRYYAYLFHNEPFYKSLIRYCTGIMELRESLNKEQFKQLYLPFPPFEEQTLIANFLDKKTAQIDEAIAIKEQQINLLKERKQIIIQQAVTQGLDPNVPMKDSGVDWIGEIPEHWEVKKMKTFARIKNGIDYKHVESDSGYSVYGSGGQFTFANRFLYKGEAVLLGRKGTIDKPLYVNEAFWTVDTMFYAVCNTRVVTKYLYFCATTIPFGFYSTATALPRRS